MFRVFSEEINKGSELLKEVKEIITVVNSVKSILPSIIENIKDFLAHLSVESILHIGCGSSYYASLFGAYPLTLQKTPGYALPASELIFLLDRGEISPSILSVFYSRSGETTEVLIALEKAQSRNIKTAGLTCTEGSTLHRKADFTIVVPQCFEKSHYMTKSFVGLSLIGTLFSQVALRNRSHLDISSLEAELQNFIHGAEKIYSKYDDIRELAKNTLKKKAFVVLGSESIYAIAQEAGLKLNEVAYTFSHAMHALEFRHGPIALREKAEELQVIVLSTSSIKSNEYVERLVDDLRARGIETILVSDQEKADFIIPVRMRSQITYLLLILPMYLFAIERALQLGYNPDVPLHIERVVKFI